MGDPAVGSVWARPDELGVHADRPALERSRGGGTGTYGRARPTIRPAEQEGLAARRVKGRVAGVARCAPSRLESWVRPRDVHARAASAARQGTPPRLCRTCCAAGAVSPFGA